MVTEIDDFDFDNITVEIDDKYTLINFGALVYFKHSDDLIKIAVQLFDLSDYYKSVTHTDGSFISGTYLYDKHQYEEYVKAACHV